jgi:hypothetical protein
MHGSLHNNAFTIFKQNYLLNVVMNIMFQIFITFIILYTR